MSEFSKEELTLALGHHIGQKVIGADKTLDPRELELLHTIYPRAKMGEAGFVSGDGKFTPRFEEAARMAMMTLRALLTDDAKENLIRQWFLLAMADGTFQRSEDVVLHRAGEVLGFDSDRVDAILIGLQAEVG